MYSIELFTIEGDSYFDGEIYDSEREARLKIYNLLNDGQIDYIVLIETQSGKEIQTFK